MADKKLHKKIKGYLGDNYIKSDDELIRLYCDSYEFFCRLKQELERTGLLMEYTNKAGATNVVKNPLAIELTKTAQVLNQLLKSLGLTAAQRKKVTGGDEDDDFDNF